jgi:asparagine synthase (glutamine-hydrolysing)
MCGIAGFLLRQGSAREEIVRAMCAQIRHRGPDDEGVLTDGPCAIGMRRLTIIDLNSGHQPVANEDESVWVVFNGEIYNYRELREDLVSRGHRFRTNSDTETLVHLYEERGADGLRELRGMFAFCIWDARARKLFLARDRFGKKPLYYAALPEGLYFASELKCLRAAGVPLEEDRTALQLYFQFGYIPDPHSAFRGVHKLMPGCWLEYGPDGQVRHGRYWRMPEFQPGEAARIGEAGTRERLRQSFDEAVRMRMIADVPLGAFLSGGIDSSLVVASMALQSSAPVKTFSIGFEEAKYNELEYASMVAKQYSTEHHEILVRPDSLDLITKLAWHFDEPFADSSAIPTYIVSEFAARYVKVTLSGDGGDEFFGGYETLANIERFAPLDRIPGAVRRLISWTASALPYAAYGKNRLRVMGAPDALDRYFESNYASYFLRRRMLRPEWMLPSGAAAMRELLPDCFPPSGGDAFAQAQYFEASANLIGDMLVKVDRASMAASLEVRCPMLDHEFAEFAASIPLSWKRRNGAGKRILLDALGDRLPPALLTRPKMGFGVPLDAWFRGPLRDLTWDSLTGKRFVERGAFNPAFVRYLLEEHQSGRRANQHQIYGLLMFELWRRNLEAPLDSAETFAPCAAIKK